MGSVMKRVAKARDSVSVLLFTGDPPDEECSAERNRLAGVLRHIMAEFGERNPGKLYAYLLRARRGYEPKTDGASAIMAFVDDVAALREVEKEMREESRAALE